MKLNPLAKTVVLVLAVLLASSAFASNTNNKGTLQVGETFQVSGQQLAAGEYELRWDGAGPNVEVSFIRDKKEVAKIPATLVTLDKAPSDNAAVLNHADGKATVSEVRFAGKKYALTLGASGSSGSSGASSN